MYYLIIVFSLQVNVWPGNSDVETVVVWTPQYSAMATRTVEITVTMCPNYAP